MKNERNTIVVTGEQRSEQDTDQDREVVRSTQPKDDYLPPGPIPRSIRPRAREANLPPLLFLLLFLFFVIVVASTFLLFSFFFFFFFFFLFFLLFDYFPSCSLPNDCSVLLLRRFFGSHTCTISFRSVRSFASSKHRDAACF